MRTLEFRVLPAPERLAPVVECVRVSENRAEDPTYQIKVCPSGFPELVFGRGRGGVQAIAGIAVKSARVEDLPTVFFHGIVPAPSLMEFRPGPFTTVQVVLKPTALHRLFGEPALCDDLRYVESIDAARPLLDAIGSASESAEIAGLLCRLIGALLDRSSFEPDPLVEDCVERLRSDRPSATVRDLIRPYGISERQFEKRFLRAVGLPAKQYLRLLRVNRALRMMAGRKRERLIDIALDLDYYDQSHFIREIREFSWLTPKEISQRVEDFRQDLIGLAYL